MNTLAKKITVLSTKNSIDEIASYLLDTIEPFDKFDIPEEIKQSTANMVNENNWVQQFINHATTVGLFDFNELKQTTIISCATLYLEGKSSRNDNSNSRTIIREWKSNGRCRL